MKETKARWWLAIAILLLTILALIILHISDDGENRQALYLNTAKVILIGGTCLFFWSLLLSGLAWKKRFMLSGSMVALPILFFICFRMEDNTGDLLPIFVWRFSDASEELAKLDIYTPNTYPEPGQAWNQVHGPNRIGTSSDHPIDPDWKKHPPKLIWKQKIGEAYSGIAISGFKVLTGSQNGNQEELLCLDLKTGKELWKHSDPVRHESSLGGVGPRTTPTLFEDKVLHLGATGLLTCLKLESGEKVWQKDLKSLTKSQSQAEVPEWGYSNSPLVHEGVIYVFSNGSSSSTLALHAQTGELIWSKGDAPQGYSSPVLFSYEGEKQILNFSNEHLLAHDAKNGNILWKHAWRTGHPHCSIPIVLPDSRVFLSSGYGTGGALLQIKASTDKKLEAEKIWRSSRMKAKFNNPIYLDGHIYGLDDGIMSCIETQKGKRQWKGGRYGHGQMILSGQTFIVLSEKGELILVEATPEKHQELHKLKVFKDKTWNPPSISGPYLVVRNHKEIACFIVQLKADDKP